MNIKSKNLCTEMATVALKCLKLLLLLPKSSTICDENCIFLFSLNQLRPKLHSKFCRHNLETRESPLPPKIPYFANVCLMALMWRHRAVQNGNFLFLLLLESGYNVFTPKIRNFAVHIFQYNPGLNWDISWHRKKRLFWPCSFLP